MTTDWTKVVTDPLGLAGFALALVFGVVARRGRGRIPWVGPVACTLTGICIIGGLALAYKQAGVRGDGTISAQQSSIGTVTQRGTCTVAGVTGNVEINCPGLDPSIVRLLNEQFAAQLKKSDVTNEQIRKDANDWKDKYLDLTARLADASVADGLKRKAEEFLRAGKLEEAGQVLDQVLVSEEKEVDQIAKNHFERGRLYELQFQPLRALPHYQKAYSYRSENTDYGRAYAALLYIESEYAKAEPVLKNVLRISRDLAKANPKAYQPIVAETLNNLGILFRETQQLEAAIEASTEALQIRRQLAKVDRPAYLPAVAKALNNLGILYADAHRLNAATDAYKEALRINRELAQANPQAYSPDLASTLSNLGVVYRNSQQFKQAADAYSEALQIRRNLANANPWVYSPDVARTLNNLGNLYLNTDQFSDAADAFDRALQIWCELAKVNREAFLPHVATTLKNLGNLYLATERFQESADSYAKALQIRRQLSKTNPLSSLPDIAGTLVNLGNLYLLTNRLNESNSALTEALRTYRDLAKTNRQTFLPKVAVTLSNLSMVYKAKGQNAEASYACSEATAISKELSRDSSVLLSPPVGNPCLDPKPYTRTGSGR